MVSAGWVSRLLTAVLPVIAGPASSRKSDDHAATAADGALTSPAVICAAAEM
jgi:hypothetical protein